MRLKIGKYIQKTAVLFLALVTLTAMMPPVVARAATVCTEVHGKNSNRQNYKTYSTQPLSYLEETENGFMRVQFIEDAGVFAEYYDREFNLTDHIDIPAELELFGGFYATDQYYFLVTGQDNKAESDAREVFRITQYDKSWNRLGSDSLFGANTYYPFDAGSCRMTHSGACLFIRTGHTMYKTSDGLHHQASITILYNMDVQIVMDSMYTISNNSNGYVSHSFNQFVDMDGNKPVALDHGDAYPRSFVLLKFDNPLDGYFNFRTTPIDLMTFQGAIGDNTTKASAGGFAVTAGSYLMAGNSVLQDETYAEASTRNIFTAAANKYTDEVTLHWLTSYAEGEPSPSTPQMVEINSDRYAVLWTAEDTLCCCMVDGAGNPVSEIYSQAGELSDCAPIVSDGSIVWYTFEDDTVRFYQLPVSDPSGLSVTETFTGHEFSLLSEEGDSAVLVCGKCGKTKTVGIPTSCDIWWQTKEQDESTFTSLVPSALVKGEPLRLLVQPETTSTMEEADLSMVVTSSDESVIRVRLTDPDFWFGSLYELDCLRGGTATITVTGKYNDTIKEEFTLFVEGSPFIDTDDVSSGVLKAILWSASEGIVNGYSDHTFRPDANCTRQDMVVMLWRLAGKPVVPQADIDALDFSDLADFSSGGKKTVAWALKQGIVRGHTAEDGSSYFDPLGSITRQDMMILLWRMAGRPVVSREMIDALAFTDMDGFSDGGRKAAAWGVANGIIKGYSDGTFRPTEDCTRASIAVMLYRMVDRGFLG